ncbi:hypothetical protein HU200_009892 [Digitaria exilis]|uniref:Uncharacterized protein n=1 Tax=Digitaria exilis TaxID=1010633 RepID=A0A835KQF8_9POAL|nr:hypothetical protein HU200_009892 [Digitaria exilis]
MLHILRRLLLGPVVQCSGTLKALSWQQRHIGTTT